MQYLASHCWHSANENSQSLLLQQVYHKQRQLPVLMACVCSSEIKSGSGKRLVTGLAEWFFETVLPLVDCKGEKGVFKLGRKLERHLNQSENVMGGISLSGVLCVGNSLLLWKLGAGKIWLLNQKNGKDHVTEWYPGAEIKGGLVFQKGIVQSEVGLLLSTNSLGRPETVNVKACKDQNGVEKCLEKMGMEAAILLITKR